MKTLKQIICILLSFALVFGLCSCGADKTKTEPQAAQKRTITDHAGNTVTLPDKIDRIAVCDILPLPSVLAVFFDSASKIVGMAPTSMSAAKNSLLGELYPEILNAETGFINGTDVNTEELLKLNPDIVFYSESSAVMGEQLKNAGFCAVAVSVNKWQYDSIETLNNWMSLLGGIFPQNSKADIVSDYSKKIYDTVRRRTAKLTEEEKSRVFFLFKYSDSSIVTSGSKFFGSWWAKATGALNVADALGGDNAQTVNFEQVYSWNPDTIFITNFTAATATDLYSGTVGSYDWSGIDAVKNRRVYKMPLGMYRSYTPGADTPVTLLWLAKTTYPQLFEDINITDETKKYYKTVFGIDLTAEQADKIFAPALGGAAGF